MVVVVIHHCLHYQDLYCQELQGIIRRWNLGRWGRSCKEPSTLSGDPILLRLLGNSCTDSNPWLHGGLKCHSLGEIIVLRWEVPSALMFNLLCLSRITIYSPRLIDDEARIGLVLTNCAKKLLPCNSLIIWMRYGCCRRSGQRLLWELLICIVSQ